MNILFRVDFQRKKISRRNFCLGQEPYPDPVKNCPDLQHCLLHFAFLQVNVHTFWDSLRCSIPEIFKISANFKSNLNCNDYYMINYFEKNSFKILKFAVKKRQAMMLRRIFRYFR
jgi:hypothetical protein